MLKFIPLALVSGLIAACVSDPYGPRAPEMFPTERTFTPSQRAVFNEIVDLYGANINPDISPTNAQFRVSYQLEMQSARSSRANTREECEFWIRPEGSLTWDIEYCDDVRVNGRNVTILFEEFTETGRPRMRGIPISELGGGWIKNGFCEWGNWSPGRRMTVEVIYSNTREARRVDSLEQTIGCNNN